MGDHLIKVKHIYIYIYILPNSAKHHLKSFSKMETTFENINAYKVSLTIHFRQTILVSYFWQPVDQDPLKIVVVQPCFVYKGFWQERN